MGSSNVESNGKVSMFINFGTVRDVNTVEEIIERARAYGKLVKARLYVEQDEMVNYKGSILSISKLGLEPVVIMIAKNVRLAIDILDDAYDPNIDTIILVHDSEDLIPALMHAKTLKKIVLIAPRKKIPKSFSTVVDEIIEI